MKKRARYNKMKINKFVRVHYYNLIIVSVACIGDMVVCVCVCGNYGWHVAKEPQYSLFSTFHQFECTRFMFNLLVKLEHFLENRISVKLWCNNSSNNDMLFCSNGGGGAAALDISLQLTGISFSWKYNLSSIYLALCDAEAYILRVYFF